eukprot:3410186-Karenia_brevis.AAC.1
MSTLRGAGSNECRAKFFLKNIDPGGWSLRHCIMIKWSPGQGPRHDAHVHIQMSTCMYLDNMFLRRGEVVFRSDTP